MVFWLGVLVGGLFVFVGVKIGFFATWIMLWNLVLSAYLAVFITPVFVASVPAATSSPHGFALVFVSVFVATLAIAYGICYGCLSGQLRVEFPKLFDIAAGILGFLTGFLAWSFAAFAICLSPLSQEDSFKNLGFEPSSQETNQAYLGWWCDRLHGLVGASGSEITSGETLSLLLMEAGVAPQDAAESGPPVIRKPSADAPSSPNATVPKSTSGAPPAAKSGPPNLGNTPLVVPPSAPATGARAPQANVPESRDDGSAKAEKTAKPEATAPREKNDLFDEPEK